MFRSAACMIAKQKEKVLSLYLKFGLNILHGIALDDVHVYHDVNKSKVTLSFISFNYTYFALRG
jgi:hypothetical protein